MYTLIDYKTIIKLNFNLWKPYRYNINNTQTSQTQSNVGIYKNNITGNTFIVILLCRT